MKIFCLLTAFCIFICAGCSAVKTRKEAAEEAKAKAESGESNPAPLTAINEDDADEYPTTGEAVQKPIDDPVLDDELNALTNKEAPEPDSGVTPIPTSPAPVRAKKNKTAASEAARAKSEAAKIKKEIAAKKRAKDKKSKSSKAKSSKASKKPQKTRASADE